MCDPQQYVYRNFKDFEKTEKYFEQIKLIFYAMCIPSHSIYIYADFEEISFHILGWNAL